MKITLSNSIADFSFTKHEEKFLAYLETDPFFEAFIIKVRQVFKVPLSIDNTTKDKPYDRSHLAMQDINLIASFLTKTYNLPDYWYTVFAGIITSGVAYPPFLKESENIDYYIAFDSDNGQSKVVIEIRSKSSVRQLRNFLTNPDETSELKKLLNQLPKDPNIKTRNLLIKKRLLELKSEGDTYRLIGAKLAKEFGNNLPFDQGYETIGAENLRFKKNLGTKTKKSTRQIQAAKFILVTLPHLLKEFAIKPEISPGKKSKIQSGNKKSIIKRQQK